MKVTEVAFTGYPVTDIERAREFYEGVLKLEPTQTIETPNGYWIEYDLGPSTFAISNISKEDWKPSRDGPAIAFDTALETLRAKSVKFVHEPFDSPVCRMTIISDPDGNSIVVHKRHAR